MAGSHLMFISKLVANAVNFRRISSPSIDFGMYIRRYYGNQSAIQKKKFTKAQKKEAQEALLEYLDMTRHLRYSDAVNMSYNANFFLEKLLDKVGSIEQNVGSSVTRFLRYNPINEFEPFLESLGLYPLAVSRLLPRNLTFLSDDQSLLQNYYTLCDFGLPRNQIGSIFENSRELFYSDPIAVALKLQAFVQLGFSRPFFPVLLARTSLVLCDKAFADLKAISNIIKRCGIEMGWVEKHLEGCKIFNWSTVLRVFRFFIINGYTNEQLGFLIKQHPDILFHESGHITLSLITILFKFGLKLSQISALFLQFPEVHIQEFISNISRCIHFFHAIQLDDDAIEYLFISHTKMLGSCRIKSVHTLKKYLDLSYDEFPKIIKEDPEVLKRWTEVCEVKRPKAIKRKVLELSKKKFFLGIGIEENSPKMEKLLKTCHGKGSDLKKRFDFFVNGGLSREDVCSMARTYPHILSQGMDVLLEKINIIFEEFKYPLSELAKFPSCLCFSVKRIRLRLSMYELHTNVSGAVKAPKCIIFSCTEHKFIRSFVRDYPNGMEVWQELKKKIYGSD